MKSTSPIGIEQDKNSSKELIPFLVFSLIACLTILFFFISSSQIDPYTKSVLELHGSTENGSRLFRMNCVGCHGISAQGLVGPDLHGVTNELNDQKIIKQVVEGLTPPMPSFDISPQSMSDLLAYLHSLS